MAPLAIRSSAYANALAGIIAVPCGVLTNVKKFRAVVSMLVCCGLVLAGSATGARSQEGMFDKMSGAISDFVLGEDSKDDDALIKTGNVAVTGFSGTKLPAGGLKPGVNPIDATFIDVEGASLRLLDISNVGAAPKGTAVDVPENLNAKAKDIGQVFGVTIYKPIENEPAHVFAAATSLYGLQIVTERDGKLVRLVKGEPGAKWMPGQFGTENGGGPGSIWKIDGKTGEASLFANIMSGANENAGPGLGALAFDPTSKQIYVPNLETGIVHQVDANGQIVSTFDHGTVGRQKAGLSAVAYDSTKRMSIDHPNFSVEKPETWGFAGDQRLVFAVAVHNGRLYYSVAEGPQIWSVGLDEAGGFADDARIEIDLAGQVSENFVTGLAFDDEGTIHISQRGRTAASYDYGTLAHPKESSVLKFSYDTETKIWSEAAEEFAVSQREPHRASNGGVALGYGYDEEGKLDTGSCQATLWVTGENLNKPEAGTAVNGLQAMSKALGQARAEAVAGAMPTLEAPSEAWMIDFDGQSLGDDAFGHVGALAVYAPGCAGDDETRPDAVAEADPGYVWPDVDREFIPPGGFPDGQPDPEPGTEGLDITKSCAPAAIGGRVQCTIKVENTGTLPPTDPVVVSDDTLIAVGPGAGGLLEVASVTPDGPEWTCTAAPTTNLSCGLPPEHLPPGTSREFVVDIDTSTMLADGNVGFSNCATLGAPYVGTACDNGGTDISVKKTAQSASCNPGGTCLFTVEITNNSSTDFNGQLQLTDLAFTIAGSGSFSDTVSVTGDLGCATGNPSNIPFTCVSTMALAAGQTRSFEFEVSIPPAPTNYWLRNCFMVTEPGNIPSATTAQDMMVGGAVGGTLGTGGAMGCAEWVAIGAAPVATNLSVVKTSTGKCGKDPSNPDNVQCNYNITITNAGPSGYTDATGVLSILEETGFATATVTTNDPNWVVTGPAPPGTFAVNLAPASLPFTLPATHGNNAITIPVSVSVPKSDVEAPGVNCQVKNTASITAPKFPPSIANINPNDDMDWAVGDASLLEFDGGGAAIITCDPTNLRTTKEAKGPCIKSGDRWRCDYEVKVTNEGPDPYKGRIEIEDTLSQAATIVTYSGNKPWARTGAGTKHVFSLPWKLGDPTTLEVKKAATLNLTVEIPDGEFCSVTNTARMTFPIMDRHNDDKTDDEASATAKVPRPECKKPPQCKPKKNEFRTESGVCACKKDFTRGNDGLCVRDDQGSQPEPQETADFGDIRVKKTGQSQCTGGQTCIFNVEITNTSEHPFESRAAFVDGLTKLDGSVVKGARVTSIEPPLGCEKGPAKLPFGCTGNVRLAGGESRTYRVGVEIPEDAMAQNGTGMTNCFMLNDAAVLDADVSEVVPNMSQAGSSTAVGQRSSCHSFNAVREVVDQCEYGMELNNEGLCDCPGDSDWNGRRCVPTSPDPEPQTLTCWQGWTQVKGREIMEMRNAGHTLKSRSGGGSIIWCVKPGCKSGWKEIAKSDFDDYAEKGYSIEERRLGNAITWCARREDGVDCWKGWTKIAAKQVVSYRQRGGYDIRPRREHGQLAWCVREVETPPPPVDTSDPTCPDGWEPLVPGVNSSSNKRQVIKKNGKSITCVPKQEACKPRQVRQSDGSCKCRPGDEFCEPYVPPVVDCKKPRYKNQQGECTCGPRKDWNGRACVRKSECREVWENVCTTKPQRECRKVSDKECRMVPQQDCRTITKQDCTTKPQRECHQVTENVCRMVPQPDCRNVSKPECTVKVVPGKCKTIYDEFSKGGKKVVCDPPQKRKICTNKTRRVCTKKMQQVCKPQTKTKCTTKNVRVCRPVNQRVCTKKMKRVCSPTTKTQCKTVQKRTCTRKRKTVCD